MKVSQIEAITRELVQDEQGHIWTPFGRNGSVGVYACFRCSRVITQGWFNIDIHEVVCDKHIEIEPIKNYVVLVRQVSSYPAWIRASSKEQAERLVREGTYIQLEETTIEDNCSESWSVWEEEEIPELFKKQIQSIENGNTQVQVELEEFDRIE